MKRPSEIMKKYGFTAHQSVLYVFFKGGWFDISVGEDSVPEINKEDAITSRFFNDVTNSDYSKFIKVFDKKVMKWRKDEARRLRLAGYAPFKKDSQQAYELLVQTEREFWNEPSVK